MSSINKIGEIAHKRGQRSKLLRAVAFALSLVLCIVFVGDNSLTMHAGAADNEFNVYTYMADNILSDETTANSRFVYYYTSCDSMSQIWCESMTDEFKNSVIAWEAANIALEPSSAFDKPIDARGYYVSIILDMLQVSYGDTDLILDKLLNKNVKSGSKIYTSFAKAFKDYSNMDIDDYLAKGSYTDDQKALLETVQKAYLHDNKYLAAAQSADDLLKALKAGKKAAEYVETFFSYCALADINNEWYLCVKKMRENCDNSNVPLRNALDLIIGQMETDDYRNAAFQIAIDGAQEGAVALLKKGIDEMWKDLTGPVGAAMKWGKAIGGSISNFLFGTDKTIEAYYTVEAFCTVMDLFKKSFEDIKAQYKSAPTTENAALFLRAVDMYFNLLQTGNKFGQEFTDVLYSGGVANLLFRSQDDYNDMTERTDFFIRCTDDAHAYIMGAWLIDLYNDGSISGNIDLYNIYADMIGNVEALYYLPVSGVSFEKDSVEWGLDDFRYMGSKCKVIPSNATFKEVIYTTSDSSIAKITSSGNVRVYGEGTCTITARSADNKEILDTLNVTVVQGSGADSVKSELIKPTFPSDEPQNVLTFKELSNGTYEVSGFKDGSLKETLTKITIPPYYNGKKVTVIGDNVFNGCKVLSSVTIPETVTKIDNYAFCNCISLRSLTIPKGVKTIVNGAFHGCTSLKTVSIPEGVTMLGTDYNSYGGAFEGCTSLESVTIPKSTAIIGNSAFYGCTKLKSVTIPENVTKICDGAFNGCEGLSSLSISDSVASIGNSAFKGCTSLRSVIIPEGVTIIGGSVFSACESLSSVTLPDSLIHIGGLAFSDCISLISLKIPKNVTTIAGGTFYGCKGLVSITIPNSVTTIEGNDYSYGAFEGCTSLKSVKIPNSVTSIYSGAFAGCTGLASVTIPGSVISFGGFRRCTGLKSAIISEGVTTIIDYAFYNCSDLKHVAIPKSVTTIGYEAFQYCNNLTDVYYAGTEDEWNEIKIGDYNGSLTNATIHFNTATPPSTDKANVSVTIPQPIGGAVAAAGVKAILKSVGGIAAELPIDEDGSIDISEIPDGEYTFTFAADNCAPRDYTASVLAGSLSGLENGVELRLYGDIDDAGDGIVNIMDVAKANRYFKTGEGLSGYLLTASDVNGDGVINIKDVALMNSHFKQTGNLWE